MHAYTEDASCQFFHAAKRFHPDHLQICRSQRSWSCPLVIQSFRTHSNTRFKKILTFYTPQNISLLLYFHSMKRTQKTLSEPLCLSWSNPVCCSRIPLEKKTSVPLTVNHGAQVANICLNAGVLLRSICFLSTLIRSQTSSLTRPQC